MGFTRNGRKLLGALFNNQSGSSAMSSSVSYGDLNLIDSNGQNIANSNGIFNNTSLYPSLLLGYDTTNQTDINKNTQTYDRNYIRTRIGICLGRGTEKESINDYTLTSLEVQPTCKSIQILRADNSFIIQVISTVTNETENNITINEVGIGVWGIPSKSMNSNNEQQILLFRKVLEKPVTILPEESYTFAISLK